MKRIIYGESVQGASHIRSGMVCQDSYKKVEVSDQIALIAVADGHGSASCPYSKTGSVIATNVFCRVMEDMLAGFADNMDFFLTYLNREGEVKIAQAIDSEWKRRIWKAHLDNKREKPLLENGEPDKAAVYKQYGTTLLGLLVTPDFIFAFQLGDGDILYVDDIEIQPVIEGDKILGTETHSLSRLDAWKNAITMIRMRKVEDQKPHFYLMSTDGFSNSYRTQDDFYKTCRDYYTLIQEHGFEAVAANLKDWLKETSELGCGDDITVVMAYFN
jgi:serine/threonine protein phosphatase PrpC